MNQRLVVTLVLGVFILVSLVQAVQLSTINALMSNEELSIESSSSSVSASAGSDGSQESSLPSNIADLPQMVGGC